MSKCGGGGCCCSSCCRWRRDINFLRPIVNSDFKVLKVDRQLFQIAAEDWSCDIISSDIFVIFDEMNDGRPEVVRCFDGSFSSVDLLNLDIHSADVEFGFVSRSHHQSTEFGTRFVRCRVIQKLDTTGNI